MSRRKELTLYVLYGTVGFCATILSLINIPILGVIVGVLTGLAIIAIKESADLSRN